MNRRGIFLTMMVFTVIISVLAFSLQNIENQQRRDEQSVELTILDRLHDVFEQVYFGAVSLEYSGKESRTISRILPFDYEFEDYKFSFRQELPFSTKRMKAYYDYLNLYPIFLDDTGISDLQTHIDLNLEQAGAARSWLPTDDPRYKAFPSIRHILLPQCINYWLNESGRDDPQNEDIFILRKGMLQGRCNSFDWSKVKRIKVVLESEQNLVAYPSGEYFNWSCDNHPQNDFSGAPPFGCKIETFSALNSDPYAEIYITSPNVSTPVLVAAAHFDYTSTRNDVLVTLAKAGDTDQTVYWVRLGPVQVAGGPVDDTAIFTGVSRYLAAGTVSPAVMTVEFEFSQRPQEILVADARLSVTKDGFDVERAYYPLTVPTPPIGIIREERWDNLVIGIPQVPFPGGLGIVERGGVGGGTIKP